MRKVKLTKEHIEAHMPIVPDKNFSYTIEQFSPLVWRVWLNHHYPYDYANGENVRTIWGFVKSDGTVMKPINAQKVSRDRVCKLEDITDNMWRTTITPKYTTLLSYYD